MTWHTVIGLEVHIQLTTKSKIFSGAPTKFGAPANSQASVVDCGLPGTLPTLNREVIRQAILFGLSVDATINDRCIFARKNYFYPDLPKGYQISQYEDPIVSGGHLTLNMPDEGEKTIAITRAHLEEDAGKSLHEGHQGTGIDLNRAGQPLLEIVSEPDIRTAEEAIIYLKTLRTLVRYLGICDGNMQEGSFRCDVNISLRPAPEAPFGTKVEIKNLNSFKFIEKAIHYEQNRQAQLLEKGEEIVQETRLFEEKSNNTRSMRDKEDAHDYRYFDDPDLPPLVIETQTIDHIRATMPELPWTKQSRFETSYQLSTYDASILVSESALADYFEAVLAADSTLPTKSVANWIIGDVLAALKQHNLTITSCPITPQRLADLLKRVNDKTLSVTLAKSLFETLWSSDDAVDDLIAAKDLRLITDDKELNRLITEVIDHNPNQLAQYLDGKDKLFGYFVGQMMKKTQGKADPQQVNQLLKQALEQLKSKV